MRFIKRDTFIKDVLFLLLVGIIISALFAAGFAMATDKYFAKAVTGVMGDFGQYDLLFQGKQELKGALERQIREVMQERFPGASLKSGISLAGKTTFFLTLPSKYKTKANYENLGYYFDNLPGNGSFSIMTEPKINISSVPGGVFELLSKEVAELPGIRFTFHDGNSIGVILKNVKDSESVQRRIKKVISRYQLLEVRVGSEYSTEELIGLGKRVSQSLLQVPGVNYAKNLGLNDSGDDYQYLISTLTQIKKFLLAYAAEVKITPQQGCQLEVGDRLALNSEAGSAQPGSALKPLDVVVKVTAKEASGIRGLIIQGDAEYIKDNQAFRLEAGDKIGVKAGMVVVSSRKNQLAYAMEQGSNLLKQLQSALDSYEKATGGPGLTVSEIEKVHGQLTNVQKALRLVEANVDGLNGKVNRNGIASIVSMINGAGDDLDYLSKTFGRIRILENRFDQALTGFGTARSLVGSPLLQNSLGLSGGLLEKVRLFDGQLGVIENSLRERVRQLDDFINRFNPLVAVLISWRNQAREFAAQVDNLGTTFAPGSENHQKLTDLISATDQVATAIGGLNLDKVQSGLGSISDQLFDNGKIDLKALTAELDRVKESLPKLLDEEIGHTVDLIDQYAGGETAPGDKIQVVTKAGLDMGLVETAVAGVLQQPSPAVYSLPVGTIQPDIRGELFKILAEVRSTIAALMVVVLWVFSFILDQSLIVSMFKQMNLQFWSLKSETGHIWLDKALRLLQKVINPANLYAAVISGIWLTVTLLISGANVPYLNVWQLGLIGGCCGMLLAGMAEKINPVNKEEVLAGLSLGLPFRTIMREIVVPAGRPGLLQLLNRWKMIMK